MKTTLVVFVSILALGGIYYYLQSYGLGNSRVVSSSPSPASTQSVNIAQKSINLLSQQDFNTLQTLFDDHMKRNAPPEQARKIWTAYTKMVGDFQRVLSIKSEHSGNMDRIILTCQFEKQTVNFKVVVNQNNLIDELEPENSPKVVTTS